jgi:molybdopterin-guanine dinucleotide biosynthesis protein A
VRFGGIVLCGGKSNRMGSSKALLPFGKETMLERVIGRLRQVVDPIIVVSAAGQRLPALSSDVLRATDSHPDRGPLEGLAAGLRACPSDVDATFVTSCDVPRLVPEFVERLCARLQHHRIAVPFDRRFHHPLAAVYRRDVLAEVESLLAADRRRPVFLFDAVDTTRVPVDELLDVDPELRSLMNLNHPDDYVAALQAEGMPVPAEYAEHDEIRDPNDEGNTKSE